MKKHFKRSNHSEDTEYERVLLNINYNETEVYRWKNTRLIDSLYCVY